MRIDIEQIEFVDRNLRDILLWIEDRTEEEQTITSLYRIDDPGVHGSLPLRGTDLRCRDISKGRVIREMVNSRWQYDHSRPEKKCCVLHGEGYNLHLHLQVHPNTRRLVF